jgi:hypothetical protein
VEKKVDVGDQEQGRILSLVTKKQNLMLGV